MKWPWVMRERVERRKGGQIKRVIRTTERKNSGKHSVKEKDIWEGEGEILRFPAIVSACVWVRDRERKNGFLTDKDKAQTDAGNNKCREAVHFLPKYQGRRNMHFKKIIFCCMLHQWCDGIHGGKPWYYLLAWGELYRATFLSSSVMFKFLCIK